MKNAVVWVLSIMLSGTAVPLVGQQNTDLFVTIGDKGVEQLVTTFPDMSSVPEAIYDLLAMERPVLVSVDSDTRRQVFEKIRRELQNRGAAGVRLVSDPDEDEVDVKLDPSGRVSFLFDESRHRALLADLTPAFEVMFPGAILTVRASGEAPSRLVFGVVEEAQAMGATYTRWSKEDWKN